MTSFFVAALLSSGTCDSLKIMSNNEVGILTISASLPILTAICEYDGYATAGPVVEVSKGTLVAVFSRTFKGVFAISGFGCSFCQVV